MVQAAAAPAVDVAVADEVAVVVTVTAHPVRQCPNWTLTS